MDDRNRLKVEILEGEADQLQKKIDISLREIESMSLELDSIMEKIHVAKYGERKQKETNLPELGDNTEIRELMNIARKNIH